MHTPHHVLLPLVGALLLSAVPTAAAPSGSVEGCVALHTDAGLQPLEGIEVRLAGPGLSAPRRTVSTGSGRFVFAGVPPGSYRVVVDNPVFRPVAAALTVEAGRRGRIDLRLELLFRDAVAVTATRTERPTAEIPAAVTVIDRDTLAATPMDNLADALAGTPGTLVASKNGGYDARLMIRGGGLKARYGIREVMVLLDGIPVTDPDSLTRLDLVDMDLVESIEVVRGPGSTLWGVNATAGTVNIITRPPGRHTGGGARLDAGTWGARGAHVSTSGPLLGRGVFDLALSHRETTNDWRPDNRFSTTHVTFRPTWQLGPDTLWQGTLAYTAADLELPGSLVVDERRGIDQWSTFAAGERAEQTADPWHHSGRRSRVLSLASTVSTRVGDVELVPRVYLTHWHHDHPVTARINRADTFVGGVDLQADWSRGWSTLTAGLTARVDRQNGDAFTYADVSTSPSGRITATLSDRPGARMEQLRRDTVLAGAYVQESMRLGARWLLDLGLRVDRIRFGISGTEQLDYDWSRGRYTDGAGAVDASRSYTAASPRIAASLAAGRGHHLYASFSTGTQTPTADELALNPDLALTRVRSYEVGYKLRTDTLVVDAAVYHSPVIDEVVQVAAPFGATAYVNAGRTAKSGAELALAWSPLRGLTVGGSATYNDHVYRSFTETVAGADVDRSGNRLPLVPLHQLAAHLRYRHPSGIHGGVAATRWGRYRIDNANSATCSGSGWIADLSLGVETDGIDATLIVENAFDRRYAHEVRKDLQGVVRYSPAAPRSAYLRVGYTF